MGRGSLLLNYLPPSQQSIGRDKGRDEGHHNISCSIHSKSDWSTVDKISARYYILVSVTYLTCRELRNDNAQSNELHHAEGLLYAVTKEADGDRFSFEGERKHTSDADTINSYNSAHSILCAQHTTRFLTRRLHNLSAVWTQRS